MELGDRFSRGRFIKEGDTEAASGKPMMVCLVPGLSDGPIAARQGWLQRLPDC